MESTSPELWQQLSQLVATFFGLLRDILVTAWRVLLPLLPIIVFVVWSLWAINWRKAWPVLATGGWVPLVLTGAMAAFVWSRIWPARANLFGVFSVPNLLWQLGSVAMLMSLALFCGWVQVRYGWGPADVSLEPPAHGHDHGHANLGHGLHDHPAVSHDSHAAH